MIWQQKGGGAQCSQPGWFSLAEHQSSEHIFLHSDTQLSLADLLPFFKWKCLETAYVVLNIRISAGESLNLKSDFFGAVRTVENYL